VCRGINFIDVMDNAETPFSQTDIVIWVGISY